MARGRFARSRRYSPTASSRPGRSWRKRSYGKAPRGKAFWPIVRRPRTYQFTRYTNTQTIQTQDTGPTTAPALNLNNYDVSAWSADRITDLQQGGYTLWFTLDDVSNFTEFTNLFDQYRITGVELEFLYSGQTTATSAAGLGISMASMPQLLICTDNDDSNAPVGESTIAEHDTAKTIIMDGRVHKYRVPFPKVATAVYNGLITTAYGATGGKWLDCSNTAVPHYGVKFWMKGFPVTNQNGAAAISIRKKYFIECKETI